MIKPTEEQQAIVAAASQTSNNLLVNALAGTAKSTTIELICKKLTTIPILYLVFNKKNSDEAKKRFPGHVEVKTFNAIGHQVWSGVVGKRLAVGSSKMYSILKQVIDELPRSQQGEARSEMAETLRWLRFAKRDGYVPRKWAGIGQAVFNDYDEWLERYDDTPEGSIPDLIQQCMDRSIEQAYLGNIDFDDQVYMPVIFGGTWPKFPLVCVDEAQDLSPLNHKMLEKLVHRRLIAVGDPWQCHPPGTMITLTGGTRRSIEDIRVGDQVVSYFTQKSIFRGLRQQGRLVEHVNISDFDGELVRINIGNNVLRMTPNHKCLVRMTKEQGYALYLMQRANQYRIGVARISYKDGSGVAMRARQEKADRAWILNTYPSKQIACVFEAAYGGSFGLPQLLFEDPLASYYGQANLNTAWAIIGDNTERAMACLKHFGRMWEYPIWSIDGTNQHFGSKSFVTQACNLIAGMTMCHMSLEPRAVGADKSAIWRHIDQPRREPYKGKVYGLTVEPTEGGRRLYVANDIVTHNSIYAFRGSVSNGMSALQKRWNMQELSLSVTFRVPRRGVERAQARVPHFRAFDSLPDGHIEELSYWTTDCILDGAAIICRNNAPLFSCALKLLKNGRAIKLVGMDIGAGLIRILKKLGPPTMTETQIASAIDEWMRKELKKARREETVYEKAECLRVLTENHRDLNSAIMAAEALFKKEGPIQLLSYHKAKGLEWNTVYILDAWRCPSKFAKPGTEEMEQELNARYVAETRFKREMYLVNMEDFDDRARAVMADSLRDQIAWATCPILRAADECDWPQIINGPRPECRRCHAKEIAGGTAGCRVLADLIVDAVLAVQTGEEQIKK